MDKNPDLSIAIKEAVAEAMKSERQRIFRRRLKWLLICIFGTSVIYAVTITIPNRFADGDTLSASKLNENFDLLGSKINSHETKLEQRLGTFCGSTTTTFNGNIGGYAAARAACVTKCGSDSSHMCTTHEMAVSAQWGILPTTDSWISSFMGESSAASNDDCNGWNNAAAGLGGTRFVTGPARPTHTTCNTTLPIACCL